MDFNCKKMDYKWTSNVPVTSSIMEKWTSNVLRCELVRWSKKSWLKILFAKYGL